MSRLQRKLLINSLILGAGLTLLVVVLDLLGALAPAEVWLYDRRARICQHFTPPPTDRLVHLDVDDNAINVLGRFPWSRTQWVELLDEIRLAGPAAIEMDFVFDTVEAPAIDQQLAAAIGRAGNVILGASFDAASQTSPLYRRMVAELTADARQSEQQLVQRLSAQDATLGATPGSVSARYFNARAQAVHDRISKTLAGGAGVADVRKQILGRDFDPDLHTALSNVVDEQAQRVFAERALQRFGTPIPSGFPSDASSWRAERAPIEPLSSAAAGAAFVEYPNFEDGIIRSVPMLLQCDGRTYGQMGLVLACKMLGTPLEQVRIEERTVVIPRRGAADIRIPVTRLRTDSKGERAALLMDIPWFGGRAWETMYDFPAHTNTTQHVSLVLPWQVADTRRKIAHNIAAGNDAILFLLGLAAPEKFKAVEKNLPTDSESRLALIRSTLEDASGAVALRLKTPPEKRSEDDNAVIASSNALRHILDQDVDLRAQLQNLRTQLAAALKDRAVLIGYTGTGGAVDIVPTSLHDKCPGVVVHGVVFNGIMTGELWRRAPAWVGILIVIALGMLTAAATGFLPPLWAAVVAIGLGAAYALVNGFLLFDYGNTIVPAFAPLFTVGLVWGGCAVSRALVENNERRRITQRFQNYVEPELVNYFLENPDRLGLEGETREMTVVFTDLVGFTAISETMGRKVVPLLNEFMGLMVPVIRKHHGYVNKFLGDGIMCFFGAPADSKRHASDAVAALCDMQQVVAEFGRKLQDNGLPSVKMRGGITSGDMVVGDAGSSERRDYTVLGDTVNLASRLEGANKGTGTLTLISQRTAELIGDEFLIRPVGVLQVVGKTEGVRAFEVICLMSQATEQQKSLVATTKQMIDAFAAGRFADCIELCEQMDATFGASKLAEMYRDLCVQYLREPPAQFNGVIVLTEK